MRAYERRQLANDLGVAAEREVGIDPLLERREPSLFEPRDLSLRKGLVCEVGKRWPSPECERRAKRLRGTIRVAFLERSPPLGDEILEALEVERARLEFERIPASTADEAPVTERFAELGQTNLNALRRRWRRAFPPDFVDQTLGRNGLTAGQEEKGEKPALLGPAKAKRPALAINLKRTEDPKFHALVPRESLKLALRRRGK